MGDNVEQFIKDTTVVDDTTLVTQVIVANDANTSVVVEHLKTTFTGSAVKVKATLKLGDMVLNEKTALNQVAFNFVNGGQFVAKNDSLKIEYEATEVMSGTELFMLPAGTATGSHWQYEATARDLPSDTYENMDFTSTTLPTGFSSKSLPYNHGMGYTNSYDQCSDAIYAEIEGKPVFLNMSLGGKDIYKYDIATGTLDATPWHTLVLSGNNYGLAWDGGDYVYLSGYNAQSLMHRIKLSTNTLESKATQASLSGRGGNQGGISSFAYGYYYCASVNSVLSKVKVSDWDLPADLPVEAFAKGSAEWPEPTSYIVGSAIVTDNSGVKWLCVMGSSKSWAIRLTDMTLTVHDGGIATSTFYGNMGIEIGKGVFWSAYNGSETICDVRSGVPVWNTSVTYMAASTGSHGVACALPAILKHTNVATAFAYAVGIEIKD
jgi:hypothetical protein